MRIRHTALAAAAGSALLAATVPSAAAHPADRIGTAWREGSVSAADLLARVEGCSQISKGGYREDALVRAAVSVPVCQANGAVFWKADMDIDCDGQRTSACNTRTDPWFQSATAFQQSDGLPLDAERLPFIVVPTPSGIWDYRTSDIGGGTVAAVIYGDRVQYAVVGDTGPSGIIGEASYATAEALGIDPDPRTGGAASDVTYILFTNSRVAPIEDPIGAEILGEALARDFLENN
ncbi:glycoside hydrolase family 75 protein [Streptomyces sp. SLBN-118]|uniref:glycoside hydrolase family 75 protein n=1 Tax=Streptomyces sp. SLBN-118 TaxID=2768454 RepID=UPI001150CD5F|nr:glycoside hydrolase family 75 protein [Streptomyces sp. SLBN-118]